jgi:hypothetical protein
MMEYDPEEKELERKLERARIKLVNARRLENAEELITRLTFASYDAWTKRERCRQSRLQRR